MQDTTHDVKHGVYNGDFVLPEHAPFCSSVPYRLS
jgi:hypothetical protein